MPTNSSDLFEAALRDATQWRARDLDVPLTAMHIVRTESEQNSYTELVLACASSSMVSRTIGAIEIHSLEVSTR